jgi:hypothetical protein
MEERIISGPAGSALQREHRDAERMSLATSAIAPREFSSKRSLGLYSHDVLEVEEDRDRLALRRWRCDGSPTVFLGP